MADSHSALEILGFVFSIAGAIAAGHVLIERLLQVSLFSVFWRFTPSFLQSFLPNMPFTTWLNIRAQRNVHEAWDVALFFLVLVPVVLSFMTAWWVLLILTILGIHTIGMFWLVLWFILLFILYFVSAGNQVAIEIKFRHRRANLQRIKKYMQQDQLHTIKRFLYFFFRNWLISPLTGLVLQSTLFLLVLLDGPAWLIRIPPQGSKLDLTDDNIRKYYYISYSVLFGITGLTLVFVF